MSEVDLVVRLEVTVDAAYHALLEMSAWMGIPVKMRHDQVEALMENIRYCAEHDVSTVAPCAMCGLMISIYDDHRCPKCTGCAEKIKHFDKYETKIQLMSDTLEIAISEMRVLKQCTRSGRNRGHIDQALAKIEGVLK